MIVFVCDKWPKRPRRHPEAKFQREVASLKKTTPTPIKCNRINRFFGGDYLKVYVSLFLVMFFADVVVFEIEYFYRDALSFVIIEK